MTEESTKPPGDGQSPAPAPTTQMPAPTPTTETPERLRSRVRWGLVALGVLAVAVGVLAYQNIGDVPVRAFWWEFSFPLVGVIVAASIVTLVIQRLVGLVVRWRRRRRRHDFEREVLKRRRKG